MQTLSPPRADQHQVDHATAREQPSEGQFDADTMEDIRSPQVHGLQPQAVQAKAQQPSTLYTLIEDSIGPARLNDRCRVIETHWYISEQDLQRSKSTRNTSL